jgi:hypothetical protein
MVFLSGSESVQFLWIVYVFPLEISYQEGLVGIPFTGLTPPHFTCPKPGLGFPTSDRRYVVIFLCSVS